jgi:hypothetical protein
MLQHLSLPVGQIQNWTNLELLHDNPAGYKKNQSMSGQLSVPPVQNKN